MALHLGAAWYPEHWDEERWREDVRQMKEAGFTVVRVGEFAWSALEPREGMVELAWLERAVNLAGQNGIATVLGTPTAAPPAWLTQHYPDTLAVNPDGTLAQHGKRCHFDLTSPRYLALCRGIVDQMARRFGRNPHVIGWQIDNEYSRVSYSPRARQLFQNWLKRRYCAEDGDSCIQALNDAWATAYWSETYTDWSQIPLPQEGGHNPGLVLKFRQFVTDMYLAYQRNQVEAIRAHALPAQWITSNFMGFFDGFDHYVINSELDLASWDHYIGTGHPDLAQTGAPHDLTRGFRRRNFWVMETQPGSVNWAPINNVLDHGEGRMLAWSAVGHGADAILYWQWRNALNGQEQYHGSLISSDGAPRPFYREVQQLGADFKAAGPALEGTDVQADAAILHSYDDRWSIDYQRHHKDFDPLAHWKSYYTAFSTRNITTDVISTHAGLAGYGYKLVVAPALQVVDQGIVDELARFVEQGGHLVLTARSGFKDGDNALLTTRQPGPLQALAGAHVDEYYALLDPVPVRLNTGQAECAGQAHTWAEWLVPHEGTQVLATYGACNGWLDGQAAVTMHPCGQGRVYYVGAWLDASLQSELMEWVIAQAGVQPVLPDIPAGVDVKRRGDAYIAINGTRADATIPLPWPAHDHLTGIEVQSTLRLAPRGVAVVTPKGSNL
jgi:beta-galactosidase